MSDNLTPYLLTLARLVVALSFAWSVALKILAPTAFRKTVAGFHILPAPLVGPVAILLDMAELAVVLLMLTRSR